MTFALTMPILLGIGAAAMDLAWAVNRKSTLQDAADAAAIAGAKELGMSDAKRENVPAVVDAVVQNYLTGNAVTHENSAAPKPTVTSEVRGDPLQVEVVVKQDFKSWFGEKFGLDIQTLTVRSVARIAGQPNICVLALDTTANGAISLEHQALVTGQDCAVYSNSSHTNAIKSKNDATLKAGFICSRGGKTGGPGNFDPLPMTDCPGFDDPLAGRPEPTPGPCLETNLVISGGVRILFPGTYCGGISLEAGAVVNLQPGIFVMQDGPLDVSEGSSITGSGVGIFLTGNKANIHFASDSIISLEAPTSGQMAGLLLFEARSQPESNIHSILSNDARVLLGTLYLSRGELRIDAESPIADQSAYTAIVARVMRLYGGPHLVLNTNYDETNVPVPEGVRGTGQPISLVE